MPESKPTLHKPRVATELTMEGSPKEVRLIDIKEAFAIVGDPQDPKTYKLPHHTRAIFRPIHGQVDKEKLALRVERTVDWSLLPVAVAALSRYGYQGERVKASPEEIIHAARHLAEHYRKAGLSVPDTLGALI